jgi:Antitoxin of toxin-antitoxin stability system
LKSFFLKEFNLTFTSGNKIVYNRNVRNIVQNNIGDDLSLLAVNYTNIRENLKTYCDKVNDEDETIIITRKDNKNVVLISQNEYNNMLENIKILKDPKYLFEFYKNMKALENKQKDDVCL